MNGITNGIAHVSFRGGGIFLPARNPYDRQLLAEHVAARVRVCGQVQVLLNDQRWMVQLNRGQSTPGCTRCGAALDVACYPTGRSAGGCCMRCALLDGARLPAWYLEEERSAG